jgi:hypothetical protein
MCRRSSGGGGGREREGSGVGGESFGLYSDLVFGLVIVLYSLSPECLL